MTATLRKIHRWISLTFLLFWVVQAASGIFLVFHREIDDWTISAGHDAPLDLALLGEGIEALEADKGATATDIFSSTGYSTRFDVVLEDDASGSATIARVNGHGGLLRERSPDTSVLEGGIYLAVNRIHRQLLAGTNGRWIVRISGILLFTNILIALGLAWPARSRWRRALLPPRSPARPATIHGWHRAAGLWGAPLALVTVCCGVLLAFESETARLLGARGDRPPALATPAARTEVAPMAAVATAMRAYPGAAFTGVQMPFDGGPFYAVFLRQPAEPNQAYGATRVFVDAGSGRIVGAFDPRRAGTADRLMGVLLPLHSGQIAGWAGRIAVLATGFWLIGMIALGSTLWWTRRRQAARRTRVCVSQ